MTSGLKNPPHMAWNNFFWGGNVDQVWIQHDTKVLQNMTDFGKKSGDVEDVHILYPSTGVAMKLIFKKDIFPWEFSNRFHQTKKHKPSTLPPKNANIPCSNLPGMLPIFFPPSINPNGGGSVPPRLSFCGSGPKTPRCKEFFRPPTSGGKSSARSASIPG